MIIIVVIVYSILLVVPAQLSSFVRQFLHLLCLSFPLKLTSPSYTYLHVYLLFKNKNDTVSLSQIYVPPPCPTLQSATAGVTRAKKPRRGRCSYQTFTQPTAAISNTTSPEPNPVAFRHVQDSWDPHTNINAFSTVVAVLDTGPSMGEDQDYHSAMIGNRCASQKYPI